MELKEYFTGEEYELASKLFNLFHDSIFIKEKISDSDSIVLSTYMLVNKNKINNINRKDVEKLYLKFGKKRDNFRKRLRDVIKIES